MTARLKLILATLALAFAPGCFSIQAPLPTPAPVPAPRLPPTQPGFHYVGHAGQSDPGNRFRINSARRCGVLASHTDWAQIGVNRRARCNAYVVSHRSQRLRRDGGRHNTERRAQPFG